MSPATDEIAFSVGKRHRHRPTAREIEIFLTVIELSTQKAAAGRLGISRGTVNHLLMKLYHRIGAEDRTDAAVILWPILGHLYRLPGDPPTTPVERRVA